MQGSAGDRRRGGQRERDGRTAGSGAGGDRAGSRPAGRGAQLARRRAAGRDAACVGTASRRRFTAVARADTTRGSRPWRRVLRRPKGGGATHLWSPELVQRGALAAAMTGSRRLRATEEAEERKLVHEDYQLTRKATG